MAQNYFSTDEKMHHQKVLVAFCDPEKNLRRLNKTNGLKIVKNKELYLVDLIIPQFSENQ